LDLLIGKIEKRGGKISEQTYNDLDSAIDYGCIFTTGCVQECNRCRLCVSSKEQVIAVLTGGRRKSAG
uniref:Fer2_BFD domain-containing protein n=1 Tax=Anisakis simplex TaxID=6269 RepID=A0A0M3JP69_ANISI